MHLIFAIFLLNAGFAQAQTIDVSIGELLSSPEYFNDKRVRIVGALYVGGESLDGDAFDDVRLFDSTFSLEMYIYTNSISLEMMRGNHSGFGACDSELVEVVGVFRASPRHLARLGSAYSRVNDVESINIWTEYSSDAQGGSCIAGQ